MSRPTDSIADDPDKGLSGSAAYALRVGLLLFLSRPEALEDVADLDAERGL